MYCKLCGAENADNAEVCQNCGSDLLQELDDIVLTESAHLLPQAEEEPPIQITDKGKGFGSAGFTLGFLALIIPLLSGCFFCGCGVSLTPILGPFSSFFASVLPVVFILINIAASILGLVFSVTGKKRSKKSGYVNRKATLGTVLSTVALVFSCIVLIVTVVAAIVPTFATLVIGVITAAIGVVSAIVGFFTAVFGFVAGIITGETPFFDDLMVQFTNF